MAPRLSLHTSTWRVTDLAAGDGSLQPVTEGPAPTIQFIEDRGAGTTGVNRWSAPYAAGDGELAFGPAVTTLMAGPEHLMDQEGVFLGVLEQIDGYSIAGPVLELRRGDDVLALARVIPTSLEGEWHLVMLNNGRQAVTTLVEGTSITARFEDGSLAGSSGCNRYRATYEVDGDAISIGPAMGTRKACPEPPGVMEQETQFVSLLEQAVRYTITDGIRLDVFDDEGAQLLAFVSEDE